ncbi:MAG: nicotinate-nucleotide adenylyltransferase [Eubacterium sp.]|nr:nicotinate-nucleotide adenylyltransferase [Eubacterium sp.]
MKKIGILGGTFNPIHNVHLQMAEAAYRQFHLDEVWFMPNNVPAYKERDVIVSKEHRKRMVQHAIAPYRHFMFSDIDMNREGLTYTRDTLLACKEKYPDTHFYFIIGEDSLQSFDTWYKPEEIVRMCTLIACTRGSKQEMIDEICGTMGRKYNGDFRSFVLSHSNISSSAIRACCEGKELPVGQVPDCILNYIKLHGLYGTKALSWKSYKGKHKVLPMLQATLRPKRYIHTLGVATTAACLAMIHDVDVERAECAGLLHDCGKYFDDDEMIALCDLYKIELSDFERNNPALIHGKLGSYLAKVRYGVTDEEILSAIACHTTGKCDMTDLEKIIYIADYMEPNRKMECSPHSLSEVRRASFANLNQALVMILENTISYLKETNRPIDELSLNTYDYYCNQ